MSDYKMDTNDEDDELTDEELQLKYDVIQAKAKMGLDEEDNAGMSDDTFIDTKNH